MFEFRADPAKLQAIVESHIRSLLSQEELFGQQGNESILAVIKPADYLAQVRQQLAGTGRPEDVPVVFNRINDDLLVFYVFDTPDAMRTVMKSDLEQQRLDESSLHSLATRNLGAYFGKHGLTVGRREDTGRAKIHFVTLDDNYEASVLLLDRY